MSGQHQVLVLVAGCQEILAGYDGLGLVMVYPVLPVGLQALQGAVDEITA